MSFDNHQGTVLGCVRNALRGNTSYITPGLPQLEEDRLVLPLCHGLSEPLAYTVVGPALQAAAENKQFVLSYAGEETACMFRTGKLWKAVTVTGVESAEWGFAYQVLAPVGYDEPAPDGSSLLLLSLLITGNESVVSEMGLVAGRWTWDKPSLDDGVLATFWEDPKLAVSHGSSAQWRVMQSIDCSSGICLSDVRVVDQKADHRPDVMSLVQCFQGNEHFQSGRSEVASANELCRHGEELAAYVGKLRLLGDQVAERLRVPVCA